MKTKFNMAAYRFRLFNPARRKQYWLVLLFVFLFACGKDSAVAPIIEPAPQPGPKIYRIPVVVHVIHFGEPLGAGHNLSKERIAGQIKLLSDDYRRREGTRGFNNHPDGGDARIEFVFAQSAPNGAATDGIVRVNAKAINNPVEENRLFDYFAYYSYWDPERYLNIWTMPLPGATDVVLGMATGPETDLPGAELFIPGEPFQAEGVLINSEHFGESDLHSEHNLGRTLTHEVGHYLGLLHTWGGGDCNSNDFCDDTPPVSKPVMGCSSGTELACDGQPVMFENYMNYTFDRCMNAFTNDQIGRMHYVLENSPRRTSLLDSPGLERPLVTASQRSGLGL